MLTYVQDAQWNKQLIASFFSNLMPLINLSHENIKRISFQSHVSTLDKKKNSTFSNCYTGLGAGRSTKEPVDSFCHRAP